MLEDWMRSYRPEELFDEDGRPRAGDPGAGAGGRPPHGRQPARQWRPAAARPRPAGLPRLRRRRSSSPAPTEAEATRVLGGFLRDVMQRNTDNFRLFGPDETASNRLDAVFEVTDRESMGELLPTDEHVGPDGRVMEVLSEHLCQGWLEGYLLTGRHGLFNCYEAFIHIIDSHVQPARQVAGGAASASPGAGRSPASTSCSPAMSGGRTITASATRTPASSATSPTRRRRVVRVYLPPDANTLLSVDGPLPAQPRTTSTWSSPASSRRRNGCDRDAAVRHCAAGAGLWAWASNDARRRSPTW